MIIDTGHGRVVLSSTLRYLVTLPCLRRLIWPVAPTALLNFPSRQMIANVELNVEVLI